MTIQEKWRKVINWGITDDLPFTLRNKIRTFNISIFVIGATYMFYMVVSFLLGDYLASFLTLIAWGLTVFCLFLMLKRKYYTAFHVAATVGILFLFVFSGLYGEKTQTHIFFLFMPVACIVLFDNFKISLFYFIATLLSVAGAKLMFIFTNPYYPEKEINSYLGYLNTLLTAYLIFIAVRMFKNENLRYSAEITNQKEIIQQKNKDITDSIKYAKRIQESIMTSEKYVEKMLERLKKSKKD